MIKTNFTRMQVLELMEYLDNRKDDEIFDTYQEELDYYVAEKQVNNINYTHSCKSDSELLLFSADEIVSKINEQTVLDGETFRVYFCEK